MWNNLPKSLDERAQQVFAASQTRFTGPIDNSAFGTDYAPLTGERYEIAFSCVRRGVPLTPAYDPRIDLLPTPPILGHVVTSQAMPLSTDEYGRAWVQLLGLNPKDHEDGAGTSGTPADSAPLLVLNAWAGDRYGFSFPLRPGMLVVRKSCPYFFDPNSRTVKLAWRRYALRVSSMPWCARKYAGTGEISPPGCFPAWSLSTTKATSMYS